MSRFRLRYHNTDLEMPLGDFVVGRGASCNLALDDALVSRRHAVLRASEDRVVVEDLGSRNGVLVNGIRITGPTRLAHGDLVTIGEHELRLYDRASGHSLAPMGPDQRKLEEAAQRMEKRTAEIDLSQLALAGATSGDPERELAAFRVLAGITEKSLALGRFEEAERIIGRHLEGALERARRGPELPPEAFEKSVEYAMRLCEGPRGPRYISYVIEIHTATRKLMAADVIDRLHELVRKARYRERAPIDAYIELLETMSPALSAADRFLVRRLTALGRVIAA